MYRGSGTKHTDRVGDPKQDRERAWKTRTQATLRTVEKMFLKGSFLTSKIDMFFEDGVGGLHCSML